MASFDLYNGLSKLSTLTSALTMDALVLYSITTQQNVVVTGGVSVTVVAKGLSSLCQTLLSRVGGSASKATAWWSSTALIVRMGQFDPRHERRRHSQNPTAVITVARQVGSLQNAASYDMVRVFNPAISSSMASTGAKFVTVIGTGMGVAAASLCRTLSVSAGPACRLPSGQATL